jgi:cobalt-zinc-cadmium efflux system outer membrane protein
MNRTHFKHPAVCAVLLVMAGCATVPTGQAPPDAAAPDPPALLSAEIITRVFPGENQPNPAQNPDSAALTLAQVRRIALEKNPSFAEYAARRAAANAEVVQALAYPNPDVEVGLELLPSLFLPIEPSAKRHTRTAAAEAAKPVVDRSEDQFRAALSADVAKAFCTVLHAERAAVLAKEALHTEQEIEQVVGRRVDAGEAPEIDRIRAQVESLKASRAVQAQQRQNATARVILNTLCGRALPADFTLADQLDQALAEAETDQAREIALAQHPELRRLDAVLKQKELAIQREQKAWQPNLRLGVPLGLEVPLRDRNQGGIAAAQADLQEVQAERARIRQEVERDVETGLQSYEGAREQRAAFEGGLRAAAAESLRIETTMYEEGEVDLLQLLDVRRTARQTETEYLQALYDAQVARIELERAIGVGGLAE